MSNQIFQSVASKRPPRNNFNLTHELLTSGRIGNLIPIQCDLAVPGEFFKQNADFLMRFAPLAGAAMVRMNVHFHTFFVPFRIITPQNKETSIFEDLMLSLNKDESERPVLPRLTFRDFTYQDGYPLAKSSYTPSADDVYFRSSNSDALTKELCCIGSLWDYFKLPVLSQEGMATNDPVDIFPSNWPKDGISLLPFLAYQKIYDDWYRRDQIEKPLLLPRNLHNVELTSFVSSTNDDILPEDWSSGNYDISPNAVSGMAKRKAIWNLFQLRQRNYERDYFTAALPEPQFGDEVIVADGFSLDDVLKISGSVMSIPSFAFLGSSKNVGQGNSQLFIPPNSNRVQYDQGGSTEQLFSINDDNNPSIQFTNPSIEGFHAPQISVNQLRVAFQMQGVLEKINRGGTRFKEFSNIIYHVDIPDARLQRVEYIGGFKNPVTIGTVVQTSETTSNSALGTLAGKATSAGYDMLSKGKKLVWEHGFFITLMSVTPRTSYFGGIPRLFSLNDPIDFYIPDFDRLGEDLIYNRELYAPLFWDYPQEDGAYEEHDPDNLKVDQGFGFTPMYSYLKSSTSTVTGEFRDTLDYLHASRRFDSYPTLSPEFIKCMPEDFDRLFAFENIEGTSNEHFYAQIVLQQYCKKPMSKYSTPLTLM